MTKSMANGDHPSAQQQQVNKGDNLVVSEYALQKQKLMRLINQVRSTGATTAGIELPTIVVIGNQSAGKSSVIEAISEIKVPRDAGTCTKCPMEVRLAKTTSGEWTCQISLRFEEKGKKVEEIPFGPVLKDPSKVEATLRRAQLAILNPSVSPSKFVDFDYEKHKGSKTAPLGSTKELAFSSNVVCVAVAGPQLTDLAFVDLPGIISNVAAGEDESMIDLIKDLCKKYIKDENTIILLTLTMKDDVENQSADLLARKADPEGKRTIGVLTKPDTVGPGEEANWMDVLAGHKHSRGLGYFIMKNPSHSELKNNPSFAQARGLEQKFFEKGIWASLPADLQARVGVPNLAMALSDQLMMAISQRLPSLIQDIAKMHNKTQDELRALPNPPSDDPVLELMQLCNGLVKDLTDAVKGEAGQEALVQHLYSIFADFCRTIQHNSPDFIVLERRERKNGKKAPVVDSEIPWERDVSADQGDAPSSRLTMDLTDIREHIAKTKTRELPLSVPYAAKVTLIRQSTDSWLSYALACQADVKPIVIQVLEDVTETHFGRLGGAKPVVLAILRDQLEELIAANQIRLKWLVGLDSIRCTFNSHYLTDATQKILNDYKKARNPQFGVAVDPSSSNLSNALAYLAALGYTDVTRADLKKLVPQDKFEEELHVMAQVRAYFQIAYKRIIDNVPQAIDADILSPLPKKVSVALAQGLGLNLPDSREVAAGYLKEDPALTRQRAELAGRLKILGDARAAVRSFGRA